MNIKDAIVILQMLIIMTIYLPGSILTVRQPVSVKTTARHIMNAAFGTEIIVALVWIAFAIPQ